MVVSSAKIAGAGLLSRITGLLRDVTIGGHFGATGQLDAYFVALSIPSMIWMSVGNSLQNSFISLYGRLVGRGRQDEARCFGSSVFLIVLAGGAILAVLAFSLAGSLVGLVAPGLSPADALLAATMLRILVPTIIFGLSEHWSAGLLNSHGVFGLPAVVGIPRNLAITALVFLTAGTYHIWGLVWGTSAAFLLAALWLVKAARRVVGPPSPRPASAKPELRALLRLAWPVALTDLCRRAPIIVDQVLGSGLAPGTISALAFGNRLAAVPVGLVGASVSTVLYPALARRAGAGQETPGVIAKIDGAAIFAMTLQGAVSILLILAPVVAALTFLRVPLVNLIFGYGAFSSEAIRNTSTATAFYALAVIPWAWQPLANRSLYALGDSLTPMLAAMVSLTVKIVVSVLAAPVLLVGGIALGTAAGAGVNALLVGSLLGRRLRQVPGGQFWFSLLKIGAATALGTISGHIALALTGLAHGTGHLPQLVAVGLFSSVLLTVYGGIIVVLRVPEARRAWQALLRRFGPRPRPLSR